MITDAQIQRFAADGYVVLPGLVLGEAVDAAEAQVERLVEEEPPPPGHVGHQFYWLTGPECPDCPFAGLR